MDTVTKIRQSAKSSLRTIVLPESEDARIQEAVRIIEKGGIAKPLVLTEDKISSEDRHRYIEQFYQMHKAKGLDIDAVSEMFDDSIYVAAMMTREGKVDGFVAGAVHTTPDVVRAAIRCLGVHEQIGVACSCFIMVVPNCPYGDEGTFIFADCGVIPDPTARQLACIAVAASDLAKVVLGLPPRVAFLSYSTRGSAKGKSIDKMVEALAVVKQMAPDVLIDGELQVDAAVVPEVAKIKYPDSVLRGEANILIFPNLEAGNISYKLVQRLAGARAIGPLILGLNRPCSDLSRGCSIEDIVDCTAVTAIMAEKGR